jgi:hypothetical protein
MKNIIIIAIGLVFSVSCATAQDTLLLESFDDGIFPAGWSNINNDGHTVNSAVSEFADPWVVVEDPEDVNNFVVGSTSYFDPVDRADRWLISPEVTLGAASNYISWYGRSHDPSFPDSYKVLISTTGDALNDFTDTLVIVTDELPEGATKTFEIDSEYANSTIRFAFVNNTFNGFKLYLDSIYIRSGDPLSLEVQELEDITIFPNPASELIHIKANKKIKSIDLLDYTGRIVRSEQNANSLDVRVIEKGIYFINVLFEDGEVSTGRRVVVH